MTSRSEPKFFDTVSEVLARPIREHLLYAAWCATLVVVIPNVSSAAQRLILWASLAALALIVVQHLRAKRRWRAERAAASESDSADA
ncbi:MAG: hypothetical protein OXN44_06280 [Acidimicrobiaceae bacterium]|nr:hypothetical protein [Acidimicrobiaceae bacterium]MDE0606058.1 hypothetical protein [Acidimicrobiaceae bacterium]